jgi:hypothetical protein
MVSLPLATLIAGAVTIGMASSKGASDAGPATVRRIAQVQMEDRSADQRAAAYQLRAAMIVDAAEGVIELTVDPQERVGQAPVLQLQHPLRASEDRELTLRFDGERWIARTTPWRRQAWRVLLTGDAGGWRLSGRLDAGANETVLLPAVSS